MREHLDERTAGEDLTERRRRRRQRARRELSLSPQPDGMYKLFGLFDPISGARIEVALAAAARQLHNAEDAANRATPAQRAADALELLATRDGSTKTQNTTLLVVADYDVISGRLAAARLADGTPLTPEELLRLALKAKILPAIFDTASQPLWLGREHRDANAAQRDALAARDRGYIGCGVSNSYCQPHHIEHWEHGGRTDIDNLCLLCAHCHHTQVHQHGAPIVRSADGRLALQHPHRSRNAPTDPSARTPARPGASVNNNDHISLPLRS